MGYHQISVKEADRPKSAFVTHRGFFVCNRMRFGLSNVPATFPALMDSLFETAIGKELLVYLDDMLLFAETPELLARRERTLQIVIKAGQNAKLGNANFFGPSLNI